MRKAVAGVFVVLLLAAGGAGAQWPDASGYAPLPLGPDTELYVMNGRLGSRHFFAMDLKDGRADIGAMGFNPAQVMPWERRHQRSVALDVMLNNYSLYDKSAPLILKDRKIGLGLTYSCASGTDGSGLRLTHCVISPMSFPRSLDDEDDVKVSVAPFFYHLFRVENPTGKAQSAEVVFALDWKGRKPRTLDNGMLMLELAEGPSNRYSCKPPRHALATSPEDSWFISGKKNGFVFDLTLEPGQSAEREVIEASYVAEPVLKSHTRKTMYRFYYTRFWKSLEDVIAYAASEREALMDKTAATENILADADLAPERKWLMALTFHTYLCNTWLGLSDQGEPRFQVWEGDYAMHSTIDVGHEVEVMAYFMPWTLKLQLEEWADNQLKTKWGPYLAHDVGRDQVVDKPWYEHKLAGVIGLPPMPVEENANFALLLFWYDHLTKDKETVAVLLPVMEKMLIANFQRDTDDNGIADHDTGTTYDASDALHVAPNNVYLGIKEMSADLSGADLLERYGMTDKVGALRAEADKILATIKAAHDKYGYLPTALDESYNGWDQASVVLGDGLLYPALTGFRTPEIEALVPILRQSFEDALAKSRRPWGVVMTEGEGNIFYSKVMVMEPVSTYVYNTPTELWRPPYEWTKNNDNAYNDGAYSETKDWTGYKYSRGVISMWPLIPPPNN